MDSAVADCILDQQHVYNWQNHKCLPLTPELRAEMQRQTEAAREQWNRQVEHGRWAQCYQTFGGDYLEACRDPALQMRAQALKLYYGSTSSGVPTDQRIAQCASLLALEFAASYSAALDACRAAAGL